MTKAEVVQRVQQNLKTLPEAAQQFQKALTEKLPAQVKTPNPIPRGDEVVLHVNERENEKRRASAEDNESPEEQKHNQEEPHDKGGDDEPELPHGHIDITI